MRNTPRKPRDVQRSVWIPIATLSLAAACREPTLTPPRSTAPAYASQAVASASDTTVRALADQLTQSGVREFAALPDSLLWRFIQAADSTAVVGIKSPARTHGVEKGRRLLSDAEWESGKAALVALDGLRVTRTDTLQPWVRVKLANSAALGRVRKLPFVDYVEPGRMIDLRSNSGSGCGEDAWSDQVATDVYGDILPVTYPKMNIDRAWEIAEGGRGVMVGLIDTGIDPASAEMQAFNSGLSTGRQLIAGGQNNPQCSHGNRLAGVIAAPRNGQNVVGVAWAADLFSWRHGDDLNPGGASTTDGIRAAGNAGARVIEMAFGTGFKYSDLDAEINYWYWSRDVVFVGAGGTWSPCYFTNSNNILWPAEKYEVLAVSPAAWDGGRPCAAGYGPELDLIAYHYQPTTGLAPKTYPVAVEQSSNASAVVAGVAALVRQRYPTADKDFVRNRLLSTAGTTCGIYNTWHQMVNAEAAVGGMCWTKSIGGPRYFRFDEFSDDYVDAEYWVEVAGSPAFGPVLS